MKIAYICEPQIGGTYTSFRQVRERLLPRGIDYRCVPPVDGQAFRNTRFANDEGVDFIDYPQDEPGAMARRLVAHLQAERFAAMVVLPGCYPFVSSLPPFLPRAIRCLARLALNARGVYWPTALVADHYDRIVAVAPRLRNDLVAKYHVPAERVEVIANGVDTGRFCPGPAASAKRAIFVGRLEDVQKDVFLLPKILARAWETGAEAHLMVAGAGPDAERLRARLRAAGQEGHFTLLGQVAPAELPAILRTCGVFLLPSRFEGCSNATLEAMASGCVPLLSRLPGITDHVAIEGESGFLFAPGDWRGMAAAWGRLMESEETWRRMQTAARDQMASGFSLERMADGYARVFAEVLAAPDRRPPARPLTEFAVHPGLAPTWRRWIPEGAKKQLRTWAARMGISP